jgi:hypothetical protein
MSNLYNQRIAHSAYAHYNLYSILDNDETFVESVDIKWDKITKKDLKNTYLSRLAQQCALEVLGSTMSVENESSEGFTEVRHKKRVYGPKRKPCYVQCKLHVTPESYDSWIQQVVSVVKTDRTINLHKQPRRVRLVTKIYSFKDALNGNNGEWTNEDDRVPLQRLNYLTDNDRESQVYLVDVPVFNQNGSLNHLLRMDSLLFRSHFVGRNFENNPTSLLFEHYSFLPDFTPAFPVLHPFTGQIYLYDPITQKFFPLFTSASYGPRFAGVPFQLTNGNHCYLLPVTRSRNLQLHQIIFGGVFINGSSGEGVNEASINGVNGEFTGTDDLDTSTAFGKQRYTGPAPVKVDPIKYDARPAGNNKNNASRRHNNRQFQEPKDEPVFILVVIDEKYQYGYDGEEICTEKDGYAMGQVSGVLHQLIRPGVPVSDVIKQGVGFYHVQKGKGSMHIAQSSFIHFSSPEIRALGTHEVDLWYFVPLFRKLNTMYPFVILSEAISKACHQYAEKHFLPIGLSNFMSTVNHYLHNSKFAAMKTHGHIDYAKLQSGSIVPVAGDKFGCLQTNISRTGVLQELHKPWNTYATTCNLPTADAFREDLDYQCVGCTFTPADGLIYTTHKDQELANNIWKRTNFLRFVSLDNSFELYDKSARNVELASKRMLGCRDHEKELSRGDNLFCLLLIHTLANRYDLRSQYICKHYLPEIMKTLHLNYCTAVINTDRHHLDLNTCTYRTVVWLQLRTLNKKQKTFIKIEDYEQDEIRSVQQTVNLVLGVLWRDFDNIHTLEVKRVNWVYQKVFDSFTEALDCIAPKILCSEIDHVKKALRKVYVKGELLPDDAPMIKNADADFKREDSKFEKVGRMFVKYNSGCMAANELPEYLKILINRTDTQYVHSSRGKIRMQIIRDPKRTITLTDLIKLLHLARNEEDYILYVCYGDDCCASGNVLNKQYSFNLDISSCDASNKSSTFILTLLKLCLFDTRRACILGQQCTVPIRIANPDNKDECLTVTFQQPFEGSGSTLTTVLNFDALVKICCHLTESLAQHLDFAAIIKSVRSIGYNITVEDVGTNIPYRVEKFQFLKNSLHETSTGELVSSINYGAIFRSFGSFDEIVTPIMCGLSPIEFDSLTYTERMDILLSGVVAGLKNEPGSIIMDALRCRFSKPTSSFSSNFERFQEKEMVSDNRSNFYITTESLCRRYDCLPADLELLAQQILTCECGQIMVSQAITQFFRVDYGVKPFVEDISPVLRHFLQ